MYMYYIFHYKTKSFWLEKLHREKTLTAQWLFIIFDDCGPLNSNSGSIPKTLFVQIKSQAREYRQNLLEKWALLLTKK